MKDFVEFVFNDLFEDFVDILNVQSPANDSLPLKWEFMAAVDENPDEVFQTIPVPITPAPTARYIERIRVPPNTLQENYPLCRQRFVPGP